MSGQRVLLKLWREISNTLKTLVLDCGRFAIDADSDGCDLLNSFFGEAEACMADQEDPNVIALQKKLTAKESDCREPKCNGSGRINETNRCKPRCLTCLGTGWLKTEVHFAYGLLEALVEPGE